MQDDGDMNVRTDAQASSSANTTALVPLSRTPRTPTPSLLGFSIAAGYSLTPPVNRRRRPRVSITSSSRPSSYISSIITSSATASNLPGAGRALGLLYNAVGRRLEKWLSVWADRHGYGPNAVARRIGEVVAKFECETCSKKRMKLGQNLKEDCRKLIQFSQSKITSTQLQTLHHISDLTKEHQLIHDLFWEINAHRTLEMLPLLLRNRQKYGFYEREQYHGIFVAMGTALQALYCRTCPPDEEAFVFAANTDPG